jgi:rubrerythrin
MNTLIRALRALWCRNCGAVVHGNYSAPCPKCGKS